MQDKREDLPFSGVASWEEGSEAEAGLSLLLSTLSTPLGGLYKHTNTNTKVKADALTQFHLAVCLSKKEINKSVCLKEDNG